MLNRGDRSSENVWVGSVLSSKNLLCIICTRKKSLYLESVFHSNGRQIIWIIATIQYAALELKESMCELQSSFSSLLCSCHFYYFLLKRKHTHTHHTLSWLLSFGNISVIILRTLSTHQHTYGHWSQIKLLNHVVPFPSEISFLAQLSFL